MAIVLPRRTMQPLAAGACSAFASWRAARAEDAPSAQEHPAAAPSDQRSAAGRPRRAGIAGRGRAAQIAAGFHHQADARRFRAARSPSPRPRARSACSTTRASRRPISPTPPISWTAPIRATPPGDLPVQRRPGGRPRPSCSSAPPGRGGWPIDGDAADRRPPRPISSPTPRPGSISPISSSSIPSAPAIAASSRPATTSARGSFRSTATSPRSR